MAVLAIDLGTSNTCAVVTSGNRFRLVEDHGEQLIPSAVSYTPDGRIRAVGKTALEYYWTDSNVVRYVKRIIGYGMDTKEMREYMDNCGCRVVEGENHKAAFDIPAFPGRTLTPAIVSSHIIRYVADLAERQSGRSIESLVVSVPAFFTQDQINETRIAAEIADVCPKKSIKIVSEPVAAALDYGVVHRDRSSTIMVIDFGGGTADICIMKIDGDSFEVLAKHGDRSLGGDDITNRFRELVERRYREMRGENLIVYSKSSECWRLKSEELKSRVDKAKCELAIHDEVAIQVDDIHDVCIKEREDYEDYSSDEENDMLVLKRSEFNVSIQDLLQRVIQLTRETLEIAHLSKSDLDSVIMVGGSSRLLALQDMVMQEYGDIVESVTNPDECVAFGAYQASAYAMKQANIQFFDIIPDSYGCVVCDDFSNRDVFLPLIPRGTKFPTDRTFDQSIPMITCADGSSYPDGDLDVYVSSDGTIQTAKQMANLSFSGADTRSGNSVTVRFSVDDSGLIHAEIVQRYGNNPLVPSSIMCEMRPQTVCRSLFQTLVSNKQTYKFLPHWNSAGVQKREVNGNVQSAFSLSFISRSTACCWYFSPSGSRFSHFSSRCEYPSHTFE